jgi:hypothetical protein
MPACAWLDDFQHTDGAQMTDDQSHRVAVKFDLLRQRRKLPVELVVV